MASFQDMDSDCSDSEDDVDYVPTENICSEDDSNDAVSSDGEEAGGVDTKPVSKKRGRKRKKKPVVEDREEEEEVKPQLNAEEEKKRVEDLYKSFLDDVKPIGRKTPLSTASVHTNGTPTAKEDEKDIAAPKKITVTEEYEFAGETVTLTKEVDDSETATVSEGISSRTCLQEPSKPTAEKAVAPPMKRPAATGGGLSSIIGALNKKKQKLSTLQKSLLDWNTFKKDEGISEELETHNKGKDGYLERQAFLQRSDLRQFEIEKEFRLTKRRTQS